MHWQILAKIKAKEPKDRREEIIKILLKNRSLKTKAQEKEFLNPKNPHQLQPKEVGISLVQINKAIKRIKEAIKNKEKTVVYGDYDTDGVCATAIVWEALYQLGAKVMPFIPKREEGYGLKVARLDQFVEEGVKLVITVDQGIVHPRQVAYAKKVGLDVIITDHHLPGKKKPPALAIVHTTQLAGCGVAWFLVQRFLKKISGGKKVKTSLDLATIGTVTDMVPLLGPNRSIVKHGLEAVRKTRRPGLLAIYKLAGIDQKRIGSYAVGYIIGPRLNAAGRMEDPMESLRLICTHDQQRAQDLAQKINQRNRERQSLTEQAALHARQLWLEQDGQSVLIFVHHQSYQEGIVGLVASKLKEEFYRPSVVIAQGEKWSKGSARSIKEFNIVEAVRACADILDSHGGHPKAAGFSVETTKIDLLRERLIGFAEERLDKKKLKPVLKIDTEVDLDDLNLVLYDRIEKLEPFGVGNPQPVFVSRQVRVVGAQTVGNQGRHLKMKVTSLSGKTIGLIGFNLGNLHSQLELGKPIDVAFSLLIDEWRGRRLQLKAEDVRINQG